MSVAIGLTGADGNYAFVALLRQLYCICQPIEVLFFTGLQRRIGSGQQVEIRHIAKKILEGNFRGVMATSLTPGQLNEDKVPFDRTLFKEAKDDLQKLRLVHYPLIIQNISDDIR